MGLTTQYHKYSAAGICSLVGSGKCNVVWIEYGGSKGKYCAVGACENVIIWDIKTGEQVSEWLGIYQQSEHYIILRVILNGPTL